MWHMVALGCSLVLVLVVVQLVLLAELLLVTSDFQRGKLCVSATVVR